LEKASETEKKHSVETALSQKNVLTETEMDTGEVDRLRLQLKSLEHDVKPLTVKLRHAENRIRHAEKVTSAKSEEISVLTKEMEEEKILSASKLLALQRESNSRMDAYMKEIHILKQHVSEFETENQRIEAELTRLTSAHDTALKSENNEVEVLNLTIVDRKEETKRAVEELREAIQEKVDLEQKLLAIRKEHVMSLDAVKSELQKVKGTTVIGLENKIGILNEKMVILQVEKDTSEKGFAQSILRSSILQAQIQELQNSLLQGQSADKKMELLDSLLKSKTDMIEERDQEIESLKISLIEIESQKFSALREKEFLKKKLSASEDRLKENSNFHNEDRQAHENEIAHKDDILKIKRTEASDAKMALAQAQQALSRAELEEARAKMDEESLRDDLERLKHLHMVEVRSSKEQNRQSQEEKTRSLLSMKSAGLREMKQLIWRLIKGELAIRLEFCLTLTLTLID